MLNISVNELTHKLSKSEIISFLEKDTKTKIKKEDLTIELINILKDNELLQRKLYILFKERFGLTSSEVEEILKCKDCNVKIIKDFYSLFYLEIRSPRIPDYTFGFHTPFGIGKNIFSTVGEIPEIIHKEQDGIFRFGRSLFEEEKTIYRETSVLKKFNDVIEKYKLYYNNPNVKI